MALPLAHTNPLPTLPPPPPCYPCRNHSTDFTRAFFAKSTISSARIRIFASISISTVLRRRGLPLSRWKLNATDTRTAVNNNAPSRTTTATTGAVEIPVTCYQLIGVLDKAEKDEVVKAVMQLNSSEVEEGYTMDAVMARKNLLMDVRDKLLFEPEYAGNVRDKIPPKSSLRIPWAWLPAGVCLLQEVGEEKLVLDIGRAALRQPDAKPYVHDLLLSMALAECSIAKIAFEKNKVSHGFEALARAQCLLRSKDTLGKMALLSQIEESLEQLAPACTLERLGLPHSPENAERRRGAIAALRELLRQGLDVETSCRIQDWPCFLSQALNRLMAAEIVDLVPWVDIALVRKNKKSIESQNQRVVVDFNCFYLALIAHIALGFSSKQMELVLAIHRAFYSVFQINKAKALCECLMASEGIDLKFEEAFCLFLLGQGNEAEAIGKLSHLELNSNPSVRSSVPGNERKDISGAKPSLETWLKDAVLAVFSDTRDSSPSLVNFFRAEKRSPGSKNSKFAAQTNSSVARRPLCDATIKRMDSVESLPHLNSSQHTRSAVKQLAPTDLHSPLILGKNGSGGNASELSPQLKRNSSVRHSDAFKSWLVLSDVGSKISFVSVLGWCIVFFSFRLLAMKVNGMRIATKLASSKPVGHSSSLAWTKDSSLDYEMGPAYIIRGSSISGRGKKLLEMVKLGFRNHSDSKTRKKSGLVAGVSSSTVMLSKKPMSIGEAEALVKQWQVTKAEALGPSHQVYSLSEVLDDPMLVQWEALADAAKARSCFWRFVLLGLTVLRADIFSDGVGVEEAEIEAQIEEAAELVDEYQQKNPNYYSTYKVLYVLRRQADGSWRFCQADIQQPS